MVGAKEKPVDRWLGLGATAVGIIFYLLPNKTPTVIVFSLLLIFGLLVHPLRNFWWIERSRLRQVLSCLLLVASLIWLGRLAWPPKAQSEVVPHVQATLIIESVDKVVLFHVHFKNIGTLGIMNMRWHSQNERFTSDEDKLEFVRTLPPAGEIDVPGFPGVFNLHETSSFMGAVTYTLESDASRSFFSMYRFIVHPDKPRAISPEAWVENEGTLRPQTDIKVKTQWSAAQGTIYFGLDETRPPDATPNLVTMQDERKLFKFDPVSGQVNFSVTKNSGETLSLHVPLRVRGGRHGIAFGWDYEKGAFLMVDGNILDKLHQPQ